MRISVTEAKAQLTELVRRAETGDEVILTRHGQAAVRLVPVRAAPDRKSRRALLDAVRAAARDCFAYEVAREHLCPLLYVGEDFAQTDIESVL